MLLLVLVVVVAVAVAVAVVVVVIVAVVVFVAVVVASFVSSGGCELNNSLLLLQHLIRSGAAEPYERTSNHVWMD